MAETRRHSINFFNKEMLTDESESELDSHHRRIFSSVANWMGGPWARENSSKGNMGISLQDKK
jgi:hypothetical protein